MEKLRVLNIVANCLSVAGMLLGSWVSGKMMKKEIEAQIKK